MFAVKLYCEERQRHWPCPGVVTQSQRHRVFWVGRDLTHHPTPTPAMGRDTSPQPRLPPAPCSLALSTARDGAATAPLGSLGQGLTTSE